MKKEFVTYYIAEKLQEINFDQPCIAYYNQNQELVASNQSHGSDFQVITVDTNRTTRAPLLSQVHEWLQTQGFYIELIIDAWGSDKNVQDPKYRAIIWQVGKRRPGPGADIGCSDYNHILSVAVDECIERIKETQNTIK